MEKSHLPDWWIELAKLHESGINRVFVLHNNVNDLAYHPQKAGVEDSDPYFDSPHPYRDLLLHILAIKGFGPILYYSPTSPLSMFYLGENNRHEQTYIDLGKLENELDSLLEGKYEKEDKQTDLNIWEEFARKTRAKKKDKQEKIEVLFLVESLLEKFSPDFKITFVMDFFEKITTQQDNVADFQAEEIVRRWALSDKLKKSNNLVIGMTVDYELLPRILTDSSSNIKGIEVPMPGVDERENFLEFWSRPSLAIGAETIELDAGFLPEARVDALWG